MKQTKAKGLRAIPGQRSQGGGGLIYAMTAGALLMAAWGLSLSHAFASVTLPASVLPLAGAAVLLLLCLLMKRLPVWAVFGGAVLVCLLAGLLAATSVRSSFAALSSDLAAFLTSKSGRIYLGFSNPTNGNLGLILLTLPAAALAAAAGMRGHLLPALPLFALLFAGAASGFLNNGAAAALAVAALLLYALLTLQRSAFGRSRALPAFSLLLAAALLLSVLGGTLYQGAVGTELKQKVKDTLHTLRYDNQANAMPEGKLTDLSGLKKNGTAALSVTMDKWQKTYFRGFTAERYTGTRWESVENETKADHADAFYWLHEEGLYGQTMVGSAALLTGEGEEAEFTVRMENACSAYGYVPTSLTESSLTDPLTIGDSVSAGGQELSGSYVTGGLTQWFSARQQLANSQQSRDVKSYLSSEEAYRNYVYENCLGISDAAAAAIAGLEGTERESLSLSQIKGRVLTVLDTYLSYDELRATPNGSNDFVTYLLQQTHSGYSVHYATLATLLLRWYGVPARYCEGYFVSADRAERYADGETVLLYETEAHAWTEYYLDGVGWIPFEVTPPYRDDEEDRAGSGLAQTPQTYENNMSYTPPLQPQDRVDTTGWRTLAGLSPLLALLAIPLALLILLVLVLLRRRKLKRALARIAGLDNREGLQQEYGYAAMLLAAAGISVEYGEEAALANQRARFSAAPISDEERNQVRNYCGRVLTDCRKSWKPLQRLYYRTWKCIYL